jgi:TIR domain
MPKILLSYRRADEIETAAHIFAYLCNYYGRNSVFSPDSEMSLESDFPKRIYEQVRDVDIVLLVIGPNWKGRISCKNYLIENDFDPVRLLIKESFSQSKMLIPILIGDCPVPTIEELPQDIENLSYYNVLHINTGE